MPIDRRFPARSAEAAGFPKQAVDAASLLAAAGDQEFLLSAYHLLFHRPPDIDGLLDYQFLLRSGLSRVQVLHSLALSEEGKRNQVVLRNLPPPPKVSLLRKILFFAPLKIRWLWWRILDRPSEVMQQRIQIADPARYWDLTYQATSSLIRRQRSFETVLHTWRRETAAQFLAMEEEFRKLAEVNRAALTPLTRGRPAGRLDGGGIQITVDEAEWEALSRQAISRHVPAGVASCLDRILRPGMVIADGGAGVGVFSVLAGRRIMPGGRLFSFEADEQQFRLLIRNLEDNRLLAEGSAIALPLHLGAGQETPPGEDHDSGAVSLDKALAGERRVDLVRLPSPGASAALAGMRNILTANPQLGIVWKCLATGDPGEVQAILQKLGEAGFQGSRICPVTGSLAPIDPGQTAGSAFFYFSRTPAAGSGGS